MKVKKYALIYGIWMLLVIVAPLLLIFFFAFSTAQLGDLTSFDFTIENLKLLADPLYVQIYFTSLKIAFLTTALTLILGYPTAYFISICKPKIQKYLLIIIILPMWMNMLLRTYAWKNILSPTGILNQFLIFLNLEPVNLLNSEISILIGMVYNFLPFMIIPIYVVLEKMDRDLVSASYDLGVSKIKTFFQITFKLSLAGVLTGITMVFVPSASNFVIPAYLGGGNTELIGNVIEREFKYGEVNRGSALALGLLLLILLFYLISRKDFKSKKVKS